MQPVKNVSASDAVVSLAYASRSSAEPVPKYDIPAQGMPARTAYRLIRDEMNLDGNPVLNLASFVTTWMEPEANQLALDTLNKNLIDQDEYPQTDEIHQRVVSMMGRMLNAPADAHPVGTATVGSSEAIMLGLLAHKWSWRKRRAAAGKSTDRPNVVFGADVHTCWEKFALYFDVESRVVPMTPDCHILTADKALSAIDENTIAVGCVLGTTFTGQIDEVQAVNDALEGVKKDKGWDIPIHVDGASGGFVAPFVYPELVWDFRLPQVKSINVSNHKFGLVYPGVGTVLFRDESCLPEELVYKITYLGGTMFNYSLNFSRPSSQVLLQYYNFLRMGRAGYTRVMQNIMDNAQYLERLILEHGRFDLLNESRYLPVVVVKLRDPNEPADTLYRLSASLRERGWIVPAYPLPANAEKIQVLRIVVKENFTRDLAEKFAEDLRYSMKSVDAMQASPLKESVSAPQRQPNC